MHHSTSDRSHPTPTATHDGDPFEEPVAGGHASEPVHDLDEVMRQYLRGEYRSPASDVRDLCADTIRLEFDDISLIRVAKQLASEVRIAQGGSAPTAARAAVLEAGDLQVLGVVLVHLIEAVVGPWSATPEPLSAEKVGEFAYLLERCFLARVHGVQPEDLYARLSRPEWTDTDRTAFYLLHERLWKAGHMVGLTHPEMDHELVEAIVSLVARLYTIAYFSHQDYRRIDVLSLRDSLDSLLGYVEADLRRRR